MFAVIVTWSVAAENAARFADLLALQARRSLDREESCRIFDACEDPAAPGHFLAYELYDTAEAFARHLESAHFAEFSAEADPITLEKTVRTMRRFAG